tara:strand:+ start:4236 stop:4733 length:498 start_codon:yes stop_codon:yes gene_type:complete
MAHYNFNKDIYEGENGEMTVIEHLKKLGGTLLHQNKDKRYDAIIERKGKKIKYEIKTDVFCKPSYDTGNIYVEVECRGKKSGIMVTEADWFVTFFKHFNEIWYIKTEKIIELIEENKNILIKKENSGDKGSVTKGWLIPKWRFQENFIVFDSITHKRKIKEELYL